MAMTDTDQYVSKITFQGWLKAQKIDLLGQPDETVASLRRAFEKVLLDIARARQSVMFSEPCPGDEHRYAIALEDGSDLRLVLVIRRSAKGEYFIVYPRDRDSDPHASYHLKGDYHQKSYKRKFGKSGRRQPLGLGFKGREHLGSFGGGFSAAAPICNPTNFTAVISVPEGVVDGLRGSVMIDLVEPGIEPDPIHRQGKRVFREEIFCNGTPHIAVAIVQSIL
jgi:hypothetical protein